MNNKLVQWTYNVHFEMSPHGSLKLPAEFVLTENGSFLSNFVMWVLRGQLMKADVGTSWHEDAGPCGPLSLRQWLWETHQDKTWFYVCVCVCVCVCKKKTLEALQNL